MENNFLANSTETFNFTQSGKILGIGKHENFENLILPGQSISFSFNAVNSQYLTFITMYGASKDWFFSPNNSGIKLFDDNKKPVIGDVSSQIKLWDNGTNNDITGETEELVISEVKNIIASDLMKLNLTFEENTSEFTFTITNTSEKTPTITGFSPGVWAVSNDNTAKKINENPFFKAGELSNEEVTNIAQMGDIDKLYEKTVKRTKKYL